MDENVTHQLILQYVYGESDPTQDLKVKSLLASNPELNRYYQEVVNLKTQLNDLFEDPHPTSVSIICEHSHDSHTEAV